MVFAERNFVKEPPHDVNADAQKHKVPHWSQHILYSSNQYSFHSKHTVNPPVIRILPWRQNSTHPRPAHQRLHLPPLSRRHLNPVLPATESVLQYEDAETLRLVQGLTFHLRVGESCRPAGENPRGPRSPLVSQDLTGHSVPGSTDGAAGLSTDRQTDREVDAA